MQLLDNAMTFSVTFFLFSSLMQSSADLNVFNLLFTESANA